MPFDTLRQFNWLIICFWMSFSYSVKSFRWKIFYHLKFRNFIRVLDPDNHWNMLLKICLSLRCFKGLLYGSRSNWENVMDPKPWISSKTRLCCHNLIVDNVIFSMEMSTDLLMEYLKPYHQFRDGMESATVRK